MEWVGGKCQAPWAICQQAACWKKRRHASMSDPSETWVNIPELFTVLPLLLALMRILTDTWSQMHTHTYTNTYCHHFQSFSCWHLIVIFFHSFSLSLSLSSSVLWAFKTENNIWLTLTPPHLGPIIRKTGKRFAAPTDSNCTQHWGAPFLHS